MISIPCSLTTLFTKGRAVFATGIDPVFKISNKVPGKDINGNFYWQSAVGDGVRSTPGHLIPVELFDKLTGGTSIGAIRAYKTHTEAHDDLDAAATKWAAEAPPVPVPEPTPQQPAQPVSCSGDMKAGDNVFVFVLKRGSIEQERNIDFDALRKNALFYGGYGNITYSDPATYRWWTNVDKPADKKNTDFETRTSDQVLDSLGALLGFTRAQPKPETQAPPPPPKVENPVKAVYTKPTEDMCVAVFPKRYLDRRIGMNPTVGDVINGYTVFAAHSVNHRWNITTDLADQIDRHDDRGPGVVVNEVARLIGLTAVDSVKDQLASDAADVLKRVLTKTDGPHTRYAVTAVPIPADPLPMFSFFDNLYQKSDLILISTGKGEWALTKSKFHNKTTDRFSDIHGYQALAPVFNQVGPPVEPPKKDATTDKLKAEIASHKHMTDPKFGESHLTAAGAPAFHDWGTCVVNNWSVGERSFDCKSSHIRAGNKVFWAEPGMTLWPLEVMVLVSNTDGKVLVGTTPYTSPLAQWSMNLTTPEHLFATYAEAQAHLDKSKINV